MASAALDALGIPNTPLGAAAPLAGLVAGSAVPAALVARAGAVRSGAVAHLDLAWFSPDATGASDTTSALQDSLTMCGATGIPLVVRAGTYLTGQLRPPSNAVLHFEPGVVLKARDGMVETTPNFESLLRIDSVQNVTIYGNGATLTFNDKSSYGGEHNHALIVSGATGVRIYDLNCNDSGGDGVYISGYNTVQKYSEDVHFYRCTFSNNKRQGASLIACKNVTFQDCIFENTNGIAPQAGVDIEPEAYATAMEGVRFVRCIARGNTYAGFLIALPKATAIRTDVAFSHCLAASNNDPGFRVTYADDDSSGSVRLDRCVMRDNGFSGILEVGHPSGAERSYVDCEFYGNNTRNPTTGESGFGAEFAMRDGANAAYASGRGGTIGGVRLVRPVIRCTGSRYGIAIGRTYTDSPVTIKDVQIIEPDVRGASIDPVVIGSISGADDAYEDVTVVQSAHGPARLSRSYTGTINLGARHLGYEHDNAGAAGPIRLVLPAGVGAGYRTAFRVVAAQLLKVDAGSGVVSGLGAASAAVPESSVVGSRLVLESDGAGNWLVVESSGSWGPWAFAGDLGFHGAAPTGKGAAIADADGTLASATAKVNAVIAALETKGLLAG